MRMSNRIAALATWLMIPAASAIELPNQLDVVTQSAEVSISRAAGTVASDTDPVLAETADGPSTARSDLTSGKLRGRAFIQDAFGDFTLAAASLVVELRNTSAAVLTLDPGDLRLEVNASFQRTLGTELFGTVGNTLVANLGAVVVDAAGNTQSTGAANIVYRLTDAVDDDPPVLVLQPDLLGGFGYSASTVDADALDIDLLSPALTVRPGDSLALTVFVSGSATGFAFFAGTGFSATTDFGNTASLLLDLPPGFRVASDVPLSWVTTTPVPEPTSAVLLLAGLVLLWSRQAGQPRHACATQPVGQPSTRGWRHARC